MKPIGHVDWEKIEEQAMEAAVKSNLGVGIVRVPLPPMTSRVMRSLQRSFTRWANPVLHLSVSDDGGLIAVLIPSEIEVSK